MPNLVVIENVCGMLTSNNGEDFRSVVQTFSENGYYVGGLVMDAKDFVPQSRKRVFIIGLRKDKTLDPTLASPLPIPDYHTKSLIRAFETLDSKYKCDWIWYNLARESHRKSSLIDILEPFGDVDWNSDEKTHSILQKMSVTNFKKIEAAKSLKQPTVGALFMRTRKTKASKRVFAEVRFDGISGCLRTPNGGSSRQSIIWVDGPKITSRLLTPRETARLMGLPESYKLPKNKNAALHLTGDGVVVPVVKHLKDHLFEPLLTQLDYSDVNLDPLYEFA
jgi:DNA (cytosine-5)-methyltransferase 1